MRSPVGICVKFCKLLIVGTIKNNVFCIRESEFVANVVHLVYRRPIAFRDELRDREVVIQEPITPEQLIRGFVFTTVNIILSIQATDLHDFHRNENYDPVTLTLSCGL